MRECATIENPAETAREASMGLMLLGVIVIAAVAALLLPEARIAVGVVLAAIVAFILIYVAVDLARSFDELHRSNLATKRIPVTDVTLDDLALTGTSSADYRLSGTVHNNSPTHALRLVRFDLVLEDCNPKGCRTEATGHAEVIRSVPPNQAATFTTQTVMLPPLLPPLGKRRITYRVFLTSSGY
jgi:hypothetical protein